MEYRRLGHAGLKVSVLSLGSWVTFGPQIDDALAERTLGSAFDQGVNFFDNAEAYGAGESEQIMGRAIRRLGWPRHSFVVSTKFFWGLAEGPNTQRTLNRKYLLSAIDGSLERFGFDFVDLVYCHRSDPNTPVEETVWAMNDIISSGKALYWGTSEWSADSLNEAFAVAARDHLRPPIVEQPQYNLLERARVESEYAPLYESPGLGLTTYSPLAGGLLTGKYRTGTPDGSRATLPGMGFFTRRLTDPAENERVAPLAEIAKDLGCTPAQLAIAWCASNPHVSSVITGASSLSQLEENLGAADVIEKMTPEVKATVEGSITAAAAS